MSNTLSTAPDRFEPMHRPEVDGDSDPRPWCQGVYAAMQLRLSAWAQLLDANNVNTTFWCLSCHTVATIRTVRCSDRRETEDFLRSVHLDIPAAVEALRQYWMPIRYAR
ncbi:UPF0149 family protein [Bradyrhizobium tropiciagri]|uniref:UPF0149 family protein n=1 Tax=Bradyrhizobium tropiciagri TaxID=312253 RepID=UPI0032218185